MSLALPLKMINIFIVLFLFTPLTPAPAVVSGAVGKRVNCAVLVGGFITSFYVLFLWGLKPRLLATSFSSSLLSTYPPTSPTTFTGTPAVSRSLRTAARSFAVFIWHRLGSFLKYSLCPHCRQLISVSPVSISYSGNKSPPHLGHPLKRHLFVTTLISI